MMPELDSTAAIRLWAQELVNLRIQELINEDEETMDIEEARTMVHETIRKEYMHSIAFQVHVSRVNGYNWRKLVKY